MAIAMRVLEESNAGIGACVLLEYGGKRILLDCGYDDSKMEGRRVFLPVPAGSVHAVVLSHGHLGHCGLLPLLAKEGFVGKVFCTADTGKIAMLSMLETALLQEEERQYWVSKGQPGRASEPLYTESEVTACQRLLAPCEFGERVAVDEYPTIEFFRAGHCPGSSFVEITLREGEHDRKLLYLGDMGARGNDLFSEPVIQDTYDHVILPAFRPVRQDAGEPEKKLAEIINQARQAEGNVLIPVSSIDRRDAILQAIRNVWAREQIPSVFAFLDSPIASRQCEALPLATDGAENYLCLRPIDTISDSKSLNQIRGTAVIIAGSGRGGYGRIGFHLKRNLARPETALVLFGKEAHRLLGQSLDEGRKTLTVQGQEIEIKAQIHRLEDPTVHLDAAVVKDWLARLESKPQSLCIAHGTQEAKTHFCHTMQDCGVANMHVPQVGGQTAL